MSLPSHSNVERASPATSPPPALCSLTLEVNAKKGVADIGVDFNQVLSLSTEALKRVVEQGQASLERRVQGVAEKVQNLCFSGRGKADLENIQAEMTSSSGSNGRSLYVWTIQSPGQDIADVTKELMNAASKAFNYATLDIPARPVENRQPGGIIVLRPERVPGTKNPENDPHVVGETVVRVSPENWNKVALGVVEAAPVLPLQSALRTLEQNKTSILEQEETKNPAESKSHRDARIKEYGALAERAELVRTLIGQTLLGNAITHLEPQTNKETNSSADASAGVSQKTLESAPARNIIAGLSKEGTDAAIQLLAVLGTHDPLTGKKLPAINSEQGVSERIAFGQRYMKEARDPEGKLSIEGMALEQIKRVLPETSTESLCRSFLQAKFDIPTHCVDMLLDNNVPSNPIGKEGMQISKAQQDFYKRNFLALDSSPEKSRWEYGVGREISLPSAQYEANGSYDKFSITGKTSGGHYVIADKAGNSFALNKGYIDRYNSPDAVDKLVTFAGEVGELIEKAVVWARVGLATIRTLGGIRPQNIDGDLRVVVSAGTNISPDPKQPDSDWHRGTSNKYYEAFRSLKENYAARGENLTTIGPRQLKELGIEDSPVIYLPPSGEPQLRQHHRIWAITDNPQLKLSIMVHVTTDPTSFS